MASVIVFGTYARDPWFNMGFDEWLMGRVEAQPGQIFVRLYTWQPGAITFGYSQNFTTALDWDRVGKTPVVRRITGGRALYHDPSELTYAVAYSLVGGRDPSFAASVSAGSERLAQFFVSFLQSIGIVARYERTSAPGHNLPEVFHKAPCFASHARYEVVAAGHKLVASAQRQIGSAVLQHGSIKLAGVAGHPALPGLNNSGEAALPALSHGKFAELSGRFVELFEGMYGLRSRPGEVSGDEAALAESIERVRKSALERRKIFEQKDLRASQ